jgi:hypothetical protein
VVPENCHMGYTILAGESAGNVKGDIPKLKSVAK